MDGFKNTEAQTNAITNVYLPELRVTLRSMEQKIDRLIIGFEKISIFLITKFKLDPKSFGSSSPIILTELGNKILKLSGGKMYVDNQLSSLIKDIEVEAPKSPLDVQDLSFTVLFRRWSDDGFIDVKNFVFNNPQLTIDDTSISIDIGYITQVMAIYLRDRYLKQT